MNERRFAVLLFGLVVAGIIGVIAYNFIAALTISVFLYYSTRRYFKLLRKLRIPARLRAVIVLASLAVPLLLLISYTLVLITIEAQQFINQYDIIAVASQEVEWLGAIETVPELTFGGLYEAYQTGELDVFIDFATDNALIVTNLVSSFFLNLFIVSVVTYYLLIDGTRIRQWLLRFDDEALVRDYLEALDQELEAVLFGNLLNVIATALIAIATFQAYNAFAPEVVQVPYPTLAGGLTGIASLIPVVGMKIVYLPLGGIAAIPVILGADQSLIIYIGAFLAVAVIVVDTIPDLILRPLLSGDTTHVGLLMLAYTLGPIVLGFYGLFFAPIILVVGLTFANTALPRLLGAEEEPGMPENQLKLTDF